ncbi:hypothetical protein Spb1_10700 [Planctopirus ephydatiae]|uniref:DUF5666 domain-containing protein n=1 Tax=Planctopirus ephydatiae TaxID=2528019 RepID=A0A518GKX0_9PLAN|nr:hypothetical protein [Planctopirus ephydatiae]QDV29194.1 hypothetical protein Spb1_10700 [Planctopirus ephydatiae]
MRLFFAVVFAGVSLAAVPPASADSIDGRVVQVRLPDQDITLSYVERKSGFTVELESNDGSVEGQKLFVGDGTVAIELVAHPSNGIFLQGNQYRQGDQFKKGSTIKLKPGFKKASALTAGDVYVVLPGVNFELPSN